MKILQLILFSFLLLSCKKEDANPSVRNDKKDAHQYAFFAAGHVYGNPINFQYGLHPPFKSVINQINAYPKLEFGVFTGDVVPKPTEAYWDSALVDINLINVPTYIAPGNHDGGVVFERLFTNYYRSFTYLNDLFIVLSPSNWNIKGKQLDFLKNELKKADSLHNVFIFCHELIWWSPENQFKNVEINYRPHYPGSTNYWSEIHPILDSLDNQVMIFAGDLGAVSSVDAYMYYQQDNVTLIGSGMGGGTEDNMIFVEVSENGEVNLRHMGIEINRLFELGDIEDYRLP